MPFELEPAGLDLSEVLAARRVLARSFSPSPTVEHPLLSAEVGVRTWVKLENAMPTGAFKIRGATWLMERLEPGPIVAPTRGNHGQALAHAARGQGRACHLFVPAGNNPDKNAAMRALGARVHESGQTFDEASDAAADWATRHQGHLVHPGSEPALVVGIATLGVELLEQVPVPLDAVYVPVGVGSCASAVGGVMRHLSPRTRVIGVQSELAPAVSRAWRGLAGEEVPPGATLADGLAVGRAPAYTLGLLRAFVDDMLVVSEAEIASSMALYLRSLHQLAEGAAAAALAGARRHAAQQGWREIAVVLTGGNVHATDLCLSLDLLPEPGGIEATRAN